MTDRLFGDLYVDDGQKRQVEDLRSQKLLRRNLAQYLNHGYQNLFTPAELIGRRLSSMDFMRGLDAGVVKIDGFYWPTVITNALHGHHDYVIVGFDEVYPDILLLKSI